MGQTISNKIIYESINDTTNNFLNKNTTSQEVNVNTYDSLSLKNSKIYCAGGVSNASNVDIKTVQSITAETSTSLIKDLVSNLSDKVKDSSDAISGFLATPEGQTQKTDIEDRVTNLLTNNIDIENIIKQSQHVSSTNSLVVEDAIFDPCGIEITKTAMSGGCTVPCPISNDINIFLAAQQVAASSTEVLTNDSVLTEKMNDLQNDASSQSTGPIQDFTKLVTGFFTSLNIPFIIIGALIGLAILGGIIVAKSKAGQEAITKGANVAAKKVSEVPLAALAV